VSQIKSRARLSAAIRSHPLRQASRRSHLNLQRIYGDAIEFLEEAAMSERPGYGDAEAKRIIERAAQIDAEQGRQLDAPALREIAAEAGISPSAVDRALQEHDSTAALTRAPWLKRHRTMAIVIVIVTALLFFWIAARTVPPP
jgi:hypothetical protein